MNNDTLKTGEETVLPAQFHEGIRQNAGEVCPDEASLTDQRYRGLFHAMPQGFAVFQACFDWRGEPCDCAFVDVNPKFEEFTGLSRDQVIGKTLRQLLPNLEPEWVETLCEVALTEQPVRFERYCADLGRHLEVHAYSPGPGLAACILLDTTARKHAEHALRESQDRLRLVVESAGLGTFDIEFPENRATCSQLARKHLGFASEQNITARVLMRRLRADDQGVAGHTRFLTSAEEGGYFSIEHCHTETGNGQERWIAIWGRVLFNPKGRPERVIGVTSEITRRKRAQKDSSGSGDGWPKSWQQVLNF